MSRAVFGGLIAAALALALAFRLAGLDLRPMHHDEANQAVKFGRLLEAGEYVYDPDDHHGPSLYYLTLPAAWLRGQTTLASLDEITLRSVPALFGAGLVLLLPLAAGLGRTAVLSAALLVAVSPALTYYSRDYIQESLFVFFTLGWVMALGRYLLKPGAGWALAAGTFAGLTYATKETAVMVVPATLAAAWLTIRWSGTTSGGGSTSGQAADRRRWRVAHLAAAMGAAAVVAFVFLSSFFSRPAGLVESVLAFGTYAGRGLESGMHTQPWDYYLRRLAWFRGGRLVWSEGLVLGLALAGIAWSWRRTAGFWPRYVGWYALITTAAFSVLRYKTPWNLLPFHIGLVFMAGVGVHALVTLARGRVVRGAILAGLAALTWQLGMQSWRANFVYPADPRNPYVYAQTSTDFLRLVTRIEDLSAVHPDGSAMFVRVIAGPYEQWPLPWYLRGMTRVGYWTNTDDTGPVDDAPVVITSEENTAAVAAALDDRYVSEFYGLRPNTLLSVFIEQGLWDRLLASRQAGGGAAPEMGDGP